MASYMPSFMSRSLSTGAEAAYGQPLAFTTGAGNGKGKGTTAKSSKEKKKNTKKKKAEKAKAANQHRLPLTAEDMATIKQIGQTHTEARYYAFRNSEDITELNTALRTANAAALQGKLDILVKYYTNETGAENAKIRRLRKEVAYFESEPTNTDSRVFLPKVFQVFKEIYANFFSGQLSVMNPANDYTGADFRAEMKRVVDQKKQELREFYTNNPLLMPKQRTPVPNLTPVANLTPKPRKPKSRMAHAAAAGGRVPAAA